MFPVFYWAK